MEAKQPRIAFLASALEPRYGGSTTANVEIVRHLRNIGMKIDLFIFGQNFDSIARAADIYDVLSQEPNVNFIYRTKRLTPYSLISPKKMAKVIRTLANYDILLVSQIYGLQSIIALTVSLLQKKPVIVIPHGSWTKWHRNQSKYRKNFFDYLITKNLFNRCNLIVVTSKQELSDLPLSYRMKSIVIQLGVEIPEIENKFEINKNVRLLFMGRFTKKKRIDLIIKAFTLVKDEFPDLKLTIIGGGEKKIETLISNLITSSKILDRTELLDWLGKSEIKSELKKDQILIHISEEENFSLVVGEAIAYGNPVIVNSRVALSEFVANENLGEVCTSLDSNEIAQSIRNLMYSDLRLYATRCQESANRHWSWSQISDKWKSVIEMELAEKRAK